MEKCVKEWVTHRCRSAARPVRRPGSQRLRDSTQHQLVPQSSRRPRQDFGAVGAGKTHHSPMATDGPAERKGG
eukprot:9552857-Ditylum_brightwellii.AAC.1